MPIILAGCARGDDLAPRPFMPFEQHLMYKPTHEEQTLREVDFMYQLTLMDVPRSETSAFLAKFAAQCMTQLAERFTAVRQQAGEILNATPGIEALAHGVKSGALGIRWLAGQDVDLPPAERIATEWISEDIDDWAVEIETTRNELRNLRRTRRPQTISSVRGHRDVSMQLLDEGMADVGDQRHEALAECERILMEYLEDDNGRTDPYAWFDRGWIQWKLHEDLEQAEQAFFQACLVQRDMETIGKVFALRHVAHIQHLRGSTEAAFHTIMRAVEVSKAPALLYEAARYACDSRRPDDAEALLERAILGRGLLLMLAFAEEAFAC